MLSKIFTICRNIDVLFNHWFRLAFFFHFFSTIKYSCILSEDLQSSSIYLGNRTEKCKEYHRKMLKTVKVEDSKYGGEGKSLWHSVSSICSNSEWRHMYCCCNPSWLSIVWNIQNYPSGLISLVGIM